jgi:hypothetical protein
MGLLVGVHPSLTVPRVLALLSDDLLGGVLGEGRRSGFEVDASGVRGVADGVVPAAEHVDVEKFVLGELGDEFFMEPVVDGRVVVECVGSAQEESISFVGPAGVVGVAVRDRGNLFGREPHAVSEERDVNAPLRLASTACAGSVDEDLPIAHRQ